MNIESITGINELPGINEISKSVDTQSTNNFENVLLNEINNVNDKIITAEQNVTDLAMGKTTNIHEVMLSINEAKLSLQMMMEVRNKALEGLHDILKMQV